MEEVEFPPEWGADRRLVDGDHLDRAVGRLLQEVDVDRHLVDLGVGRHLLDGGVDRHLLDWGVDRHLLGQAGRLHPNLNNLRSNLHNWLSKLNKNNIIRMGFSRNNEEIGFNISILIQMTTFVLSQHLYVRFRRGLELLQLRAF